MRQSPLGHDKVPLCQALTKEKSPVSFSKGVVHKVEGETGVEKEKLQKLHAFAPGKQQRATTSEKEVVKPKCPSAECRELGDVPQFQTLKLEGSSTASTIRNRRNIYVSIKSISVWMHRILAGARALPVPVFMQPSLF